MPKKISYSNTFVKSNNINTCILRDAYYICYNNDLYIDGGILDNYAIQLGNHDTTIGFLVKSKLYNYDNIEIQHQPYNYSDIYEYGIYRTHPFKHVNDIDYNLAELSDKMTILDAGCGMLGPSIYFADKLPNLKIHALTRANDKMKSEIYF